MKMFALAIFLISGFLQNVFCINEILRSQAILYGIVSIISEEFRNDTSSCYQQLTQLYQAIEENKVWGIKMLDASGQPESGFLYGNNFWLGSRSQCMDIVNQKKFETGLVEREYQYPDDFPPYQLNFFVVHMKHNSTLQQHTSVPVEYTIQMGLCLPSLCSSEEIKVLSKEYFNKGYLQMQKLFNLRLSIIEVRKLKTDGLWMFKLLKTQLFIVTSGIILLLTIVGTIVDVKESNRQNNMVIGSSASANKMTKTNASTTEIFTSSEVEKKLTLRAILTSFSFYSNTKRLMKTTLSEDAIPCIHGLKFFSISYVIGVHSLLYINDYTDNMPIIFRLSEDLIAQTFSNATYSVDTFLFLSGFLTAYLFYRNQKSTSSASHINLKKKLLMFWLMLTNRFFRLTPPYLMLIIFSNFIYTCSRSTSVLSLFSERPDEMCSLYWWRNVLYINNLFPRTEMCLSWSWYLAVDFQFYITSSFLLILSTIAFKFSATMVLLLILCNIVITTVKSYRLNYIPTLDQQFLHLDELYDLPWDRIGPYLIGVISGYILFVKLNNKLSLKKKTKIILWIVFPFLNIWILFALYKKQLSVIVSAIYVGTSRTLWGIGIAWVVISCCTGNAGILNKFLSFKGFVPLSRLSYCAYLLNPLVVNMLFSGFDKSFNASRASLAMAFFGVMFLTFLISFFFSILFEAPFLHINVLIFRKINSKPNDTIGTPQR